MTELAVVAIAFAHYLLYLRDVSAAVTPFAIFGLSYIFRGKLSEIHVLVNSNLTAVKAALIESTTISQAHVEEIKDLKHRLVEAESKDDPAITEK